MSHAQEKRVKQARRRARQRGLWLVEHTDYDATEAWVPTYSYNLVPMGTKTKPSPGYRGPRGMVFAGVGLDAIERWLDGTPVLWP